MKEYGMGFTEKQIEALCQDVDDVFAGAPTRVRNVLKQQSNGICETRYLGQLLAHTEHDFVHKIPGSSKKTAAYIVETLQDRGYALGALAAHRDVLVDLFRGDDFAAQLRRVEFKGVRDLSVLPRDVEKETDATWVKSHFPSYQQDIPEQFIAAALGDPRVERKFKAFIDFAIQVSHEKLNREGGPS